MCHGRVVWMPETAVCRERCLCLWDSRWKLASNSWRNLLIIGIYPAVSPIHGDKVSYLLHTYNIFMPVVSVSSSMESFCPESTDCRYWLVILYSQCQSVFTAGQLPSMLATAVGSEMCRWDSGAFGSKLVLTSARGCQEDERNEDSLHGRHRFIVWRRPAYEWEISGHLTHILTCIQPTDVLGTEK